MGIVPSASSQGGQLGPPQLLVHTVCVAFSGHCPTHSTHTSCLGMLPLWAALPCCGLGSGRLPSLLLCQLLEVVPPQLSSQGCLQNLSLWPWAPCQLLPEGLLLPLGAVYPSWWCWHRCGEQGWELCHLLARREMASSVRAHAGGQWAPLALPRVSKVWTSSSCLSVFPGRGSVCLCHVTPGSGSAVPGRGWGMPKPDGSGRCSWQQLAASLPPCPLCCRRAEPEQSCSSAQQQSRGCPGGQRVKSLPGDRFP